MAKAEKVRPLKQASVRVDPPVMAKVDKYAKREKLTRSRALEHMIRIGLDQIYPPSRAAVDALSDPVRSELTERIKQLPDLHLMVAEEVARIEVEMLVQVIGGEIANRGREFQRSVEAAGKKISDFDDIGDVNFFLAVYYKLMKEEEKQDSIKNSLNIVQIMPHVERQQKKREKQMPRKKIYMKSKTV